MNKALLSFSFVFAACCFAGCTSPTDPPVNGCDNYEVPCGDGCMPVGASCCNDGDYCAAGSYCESNYTCLVPNTYDRTKELASHPVAK